MELLFPIHLILCIFIQNTHTFLKSPSQVSESNAQSLCQNALFHSITWTRRVQMSLGWRYPAEHLTGNPTSLHNAFLTLFSTHCARWQPLWLFMLLTPQHSNLCSNSWLLLNIPSTDITPSINWGGGGCLHREIGTVNSSSCA